MKKSFMTRALATGLSLAMAFSLSAATNVSVASAAAKPAMKSTTMTVKVGQSKNYQATAATQKAYKITAIKMSAAGKTKATVKINSSKKSIKVTGKAATKGSNVIVTFKNNSTKKLTKVTTKVVVKDETPVDTATKIADVKQKTFTEFTVTMSKALETVAASDFTMVRDNDNQVITVKAASLDATDKTKVNLTVYTSLTDAKTYTVTYTAADEAKTQSSKQVTVTDGVVADVAITPVEITANSETKIEYQTLDATGVIISQKGVTKTELNVSVTWDSVLGTMDNDSSKYILYNVGDTAKFTVTYHTYKYDATTGAETGVITKDFTVTAVKDATVITQYNYTIATYEPFNWSKVTPKQTLAVDDTNRLAYFLIKDTNGADVTGSCGYTVESSDNSVIVADGAVKDGVTLAPVNKGSAFLMIKDKDGKVVHTLPITVGDKRTIATFKLSAPVVSIVSNAATTNPTSCGWTDMTILDQYGDPLSGVNVTIDSDKSTQSHSDLIINPTGAAGSIQIVSDANATGTNEGRDNYVLSAQDGLGKTMITSLTVNTINALGTPTYSVAFLDKSNDKIINTMDTTISEDPNVDADAGKNVVAYVVKKRNGVVVGTDSAIKVASMTVKKNDGSIVAKVVSADGIDKAISGSAITPAAVTNVTSSAMNVGVDTVVKSASTVSKYLGVGSYQYYFDLVVGTRPDRAVGTLAVTDTQTAVTAKVLETSYNSPDGDICAVFDNNKYVKFYYGDKEALGYVAPGTKASVDYTVSNGDKNAYVKSVTVTVKVANSKSLMTVTVPINKTFVTTGKPWIKK